MTTYLPYFVYLLTWTLLLAGSPSTALAQQDSGGKASGQDSVRVVPKPDEERVDVFIGNELFTSYLFTQAHDVLKKPALYPIKTARGTEITRRYPLSARAGERADHPHHVGYWFNYGNVNGLDFWGHSTATPAGQSDEMGTIMHRAIERVESGADRGVLEVTADWVNADGEPLLREDTRFVFRAGAPGKRVIDRITTLEAESGRVDFPDTKEGFLGLRVTRALEMPSDEPVLLTDQSGEPMADPMMDNEGVTGHYRNSEGIEGYPDVWGKRAKWMTLSGVVKGTPVTVALFDHPRNVGYPTYWHARDYGLFSANPLGQKTFSDGAEEMNFSLAPGESTTFRYRLLILLGKKTTEEIESHYQKWAE